MKIKTATFNTKDLNIIKPENCKFEDCTGSIKLLEKLVEYYSINEPQRDLTPFKTNLEKFKNRLIQLTLN